MSIKIAIAGQPPIVVDEENFTVGSDAGCAVVFPASADVKPKHAVIRMIAGRWLIESREGDAVFVGGTDPKRLHWLSPGDLIGLSENGPAFIFQPLEETPVASQSSVLMPPDSDPVITTNRPTSASALPVRSRDSSGSIPLIEPRPVNSPPPPLPAWDDEPPTKVRINSIGPSTPPTEPSLSEPVNVSPPALKDEASDGRTLLKRSSSWSEPAEVIGQPEQETEIEWVFKVIFWAVATGAVILLALFAIKSM